MTIHRKHCDAFDSPLKLNEFKTKQKKTTEFFFKKKNNGYFFPLRLGRPRCVMDLAVENIETNVVHLVVGNSDIEIRGRSDNAMTSNSIDASAVREARSAPICVPANHIYLPKWSISMSSIVFNNKNRG